MAYDKIVDSTFLNEGLLSIANAIREKSDYAMAMTFPSGFISAISEITTGSSSDSGTTNVPVVTPDVENVVSGTITITTEESHVILEDALPIRTQAPKAFWIFESGCYHYDDTTHHKNRLLANMYIRGDGCVEEDTSGTYYCLYFYVSANSNSGNGSVNIVYNGFDGTYPSEDIIVIKQVMSGNYTTGELFFGCQGTTHGLLAGRTYNYGVWLWDE